MLRAQNVNAVIQMDNVVDFASSTASARTATKQPTYNFSLSLFCRWLRRVLFSQCN